MTEIRYQRSTADLSPTSVLVVPLFAQGHVVGPPETGDLDLQAIRDTLPKDAIVERRYEATLVPSDGKRSHILFVGAGKQSTVDGLVRLRIAAVATRYLSGRGFRSVAFLHSHPEDGRDFGRAVVEGALRGTYDPGLRKSKDRTPRALEEIVLISVAEKAEVERGARVGQAVGEASALARDLINLPPNDLTPTTFAERARAVAEAEGLRFESLGEAEMRDLGMGSLLGVTSGSDQEARLFSLSYGDETSAIRLALVGKGITFDSGGLSIKPGPSMETMKGDMGGGAAVVAAMQAIARLAPPGISITGYVGASENMLGGSAMRPGDVLTAMNGTTIEILNTDAEGRLVLADVLAYAVSKGATYIVDIATLTGAAAVSLGSATSLGTGTPENWLEEVVSAARDGCERLWPMPMYEEYRRNMDSPVADIKNSGPRGGGALNAAAFLREFVDDVPWAHMDIAGTSWQESAQPFAPPGGSGVGIGTLVSLADSLSGTVQRGRNP